MSQLNLHITAEFQKTLKLFMRVRHIENKSEAIRIAIKESLDRALYQGAHYDYSNWLGAAKSKQQNSKQKFKSDNDLWK